MRISHRVQKTETFSRGTTIEYVTIIVCVAIYIAVSMVHRNISTRGINEIVLFGIFFSSFVVSGIMTQIQVLTSVYLSINSLLKGYATALALNLYGIGIAVYGMIVTKDQSPLPGIITYTGTITIISIIYMYRKRLYHSFKELSAQKEELYTLYEEISISEEKLSIQNEELLRYNRIMKENEKQLLHMAFYDALTGLPNRKMIIEKLNKFILRSKKKNRRFAFVFIDLDNFKEINDLMGHFVGDTVLQTVAEIWKSRINSRDVLGRLGGDEFALIIRRELSHDEILSYIRSLKEELSHALTVENKKLHMTASFGIAMYPQDGDNATDLMKSSDITMYTVKNSGKNDIQFFCQDMQRELLDKMKLENALKTSLANNELYMVYQPQYFCGSNRIRGFEALARWHSAELGPVSPAQFIPIAEETGQIAEIGKWIMRTVLTKFKNVRVRYSSDFIVSINISVIEIIQPTFVESVRGILDETGFDTRCLEIEVTESVFITNPGKVIGVLNQLKEMGIRIALDDFGTGYASLKYLQMLPIDTLKIDKVFIDRVKENHEDNRIVGAVISLAHEMGIAVIAEGVEKTMQMEYLCGQKCDYIQGFLMSKPLDDHQLEQLIRSNGC